MRLVIHFVWQENSPSLEQVCGHESTHLAGGWSITMKDIEGVPGWLSP